LFLKPKYRIKILQPVHFKTNRATLLKRSYAVLDQVAALLQSHPNLCVEVQGHGDRAARH
jgi:outer membrane protein OmpA-like peptidoglycan-associated protein